MKNYLTAIFRLTSIAAIVSIFITAANAGVLRPQLISRTTSGATPNGQSRSFAASSDGRFVVYESAATNIVAGLTDTNNNSDLFLYDTLNGTTRCISLSITGANKTGNSYSTSPIISPDGRYIVFRSLANDLVANDGNNSDDIFRYDVGTGQIVMVSVKLDGTDGANGNSGLFSGTYKPYDMSDDGRYIAFTSFGTNLTNLPDTNNGSDIFVRDMVAGTTRMISTNAAGTAAANNPINGLQFVSTDVNISADGRIVTYQSTCDNIVAGITDGNLNYDIYVKNLQTNQTRVVGLSYRFANQTANAGATAPVLSKSGNRIAYASFSADIVSTKLLSNNKRDVFVYDIGLNTSFLVSVNSAGTDGGNLDSESPGLLDQHSITPDGRFIIFQSRASDLDPAVADSGNGMDVFRRDLATGTTQMVSVNLAGTASGNAGSFDGKKATSISNDGRFITFNSTASTILRENFAFDNNSHTFVRDMLLGNTFTASGNNAGAAFANGSDDFAAVSGNGKWVTYASAADNLVTGDGNSNFDVFHARMTVPQPSVSDFNGDGLTDLGVFRPSTGYWYVLNNDLSFAYLRPWGSSTDIIVPADFTGDGATDYAVFRNGSWLINDSINFSAQTIAFGQAGDKPIPQDFDGDGKADVAVFRPSTGVWYWQGSLNGQFNAVPFGLSTDVPVQGDFDVDGRADVAVFRPSDGNWYIRRSSDAAFQAVHFGQSGDKPVPADFDGDGKTDIAVFRAGTWYVLNSGTGSFSATQFGLATDIPVAGSYDADGKAEIAVWRPSEGNWYILRSSNNAFVAMHFGQSGDQPAPAAFNP